MLLKNRIIITIVCCLLLSGCIRPARLTEEPPPLSTRYAQILQTLTPGSLPTSSSLRGEPTTPKTEIPLQTSPQVYLHPGLPEGVIQALPLEGVQIVVEPQANIGRINLSPLGAETASEEPAIWTYVLVAPFFTQMDGISFVNLQKLWQGSPPTGFPLSQILVTSSVQSAISTILGTPNSNYVKIVSGDKLQSKALTDEPFISIIPFEDLNPEFKTLRIDGISPLDEGFTPENYQLSVNIWAEGNWSGPIPSLPKGNYDPNLRTTLIMTGVTALTRATAYQMAMRGETFPGQDIRAELLQADVTHISHEVPFAENCPDPNPVQENLIFCASPERIALLEDIGTDVIELTGNHLLDYGEAAAKMTIQMYRERGWLTYAGGLDVTEAQTPAQITHNGNRLAFIGCNLPGPPNVWATNSQPGAAACSNYVWLEESIQAALAEGYLPIVTLQYNEDYSAIPGPQMVRDFLRLAEAGAVVVNGSQAHTPKIMGFHQNSFIHFGLGNLFFDQMEVYYQDILMEGTRDEFIDRLVFYNNRLVSVELLTAKLEDYARPRPMTLEERDAFLSRIFNLALDYQGEWNP